MTPLPLLATLAAGFGGARDQRTVFRVLRDFVVHATGGDALVISLVNVAAGHRTAAYIWSAAAADGSADPASGIEFDTAALPAIPLDRDSPANRAVHTRAPVLIERDRVTGQTQVLHTRANDIPRSSMSVPMLAGERLVGVFEIQSGQEAAFGPQHLPPLSMAANLAALAIENVRLLEERHALAERLAVLAARFQGAREPLDVYRALRDFVVETTDCNGIVVSTFDAATETKTCVYAWADGHEADVAALPPTGVRGQHPHSRAIATGQPVIESDLQRATRQATTITVIAAADDDRPARSSIAVPMLRDGRVLGAFEAQSVLPAAFSEPHLGPLSMAANLVAVALENVALNQRTRSGEERLRLALAAGRMGTWDWDPAEGRVTWSPETEALYGLPPGSFAGTYEAYLALIHPRDRKRVRATIEAAAAGTGEADFTVEHRVVWPDGTVRWVEGHGRAYFDGAGRLQRLAGTAQDTTERRASAAALRRALVSLKKSQDRVVQQERLRALGEMASGIAHDFNNALAPVVGFSELLLERPENLQNPATAVEYLKLIRTGATDAASVVGRLREFYRPRAPDELFQPVDLNSIVVQAVGLTQPKWRDQALAGGRTITVETDLGPVPAVLGNEAELREALVNLIFNGVDAMPEGGTITLRTRAAAHDTGSGRRTRRGRVVLEVADNGVGMTKDVRQRCLEPFFSTKGARGTGMGLAMVYGIVGRHGGALDIESEVGLGTTVRLTLPVAALQEAVRRATAAAPAEHLRVLIVDDDPMVRQVTAAYLEAEGHAPTAAASGQEALEHLQRASFDLVMTDMAMPEMSGEKLAAAVKQRLPAMPVILVTGFGDFMLTANERPAAVDAIVSKPLTLTNLRQALAAALNGSGGRRRSRSPAAPRD